MHGSEELEVREPLSVHAGTVQQVPGVAAVESALMMSADGRVVPASIKARGHALRWA
jgi:hypothetical protein